MSAKLHGPFDELYEIGSSADLAASSSGGFMPRDAELLERLMRRVIDDPVSEAAIRGLLRRTRGWAPDDPRSLGRELSRLVTESGVVLRKISQPGVARSGVLPGVTLRALGEILESEGSGTEVERLVRRWRFECAHHAQGDRDLIDQQGRLSVVPDPGQLEDRVLIHIKDEHRPPPPAIYAGSQSVPKSGSSDGYEVYELAARFDGDVSQTNLLSPRFWAAYREPTIYAISGAPSPLTVAVYNPRRYKLELALPPMRSMKYGSKLTQGIAVEGKRLVTSAVKRQSWNREDSAWAPSSLTRVAREQKSGATTSQSMSKALFDSCAFAIDGKKTDLEILELIGALLNMASAIQDIVDAIQENAPQVGWYMQFDIQLMQGGLALEWHWKEHTNHQVFQYIDANIELTILALAFELGIGISGLGFKAQVFAQLAGELSVSLDGKRDDPSWASSAALQAENTYVGAIGVRFEAGNLFKAEGKGETGIEIEAALSLNGGSEHLLRCDASVEWTGLRVSAVVRGGLFGIGAERTWERTLVRPKPLGTLRWPRREPYSPPQMSRETLKRVILGVITEGLNVRVIREREGFFNNVHWTPDQIASVIADRMDRHRTFSRKRKVVEGIAHAIRQDLDLLGARSWRRDYIEERAFLTYVDGPELRAHLDAAVPPEAELAQAAGT